MKIIRLKNSKFSFLNSGEKYNITALSIVAFFMVATADAQNTNYGQDALTNNAGGTYNTGLGFKALYNNTDGSFNSASGAFSLQANTTGNYNTANGYSALGGNTTGRYNTGTGYLALSSNTTAQYNTANGANALQSNTTGDSNSAFGVSALKENTSGHFNTAVGVSASRMSTSSDYNTALGYQALHGNLSGSSNTAVGYRADVSGSLNNATAIGANAIASANNSIQLGDALVTKIFAGTGTNAKLITGTLQIKGGAPGIGKVLTSDASGNGTWQTLATGGWVLSGPDLMYTEGMVSIGTDLVPNGYKLAVGGKIISEEVILMLKENWPDYVFEKTYKLPSLPEVEKYIRRYKHLPEVPTEKEVLSDGINIGHMNVILLKKVEELTLYMIDLEKKITTQQNAIDTLKRKR